MFGPIIFTKNLGGGFRLFLNPIKRPIPFMLLGMPLIIAEIVAQCVRCAYYFAKALVLFSASAIGFLYAGFLTLKTNKEDK
tara:strand:+ start:1053 stop:1295 length:243 start_codon:yes stop_codon:yes gene_type:complete